VPPCGLHKVVPFRADDFQQVDAPRYLKWAMIDEARETCAKFPAWSYLCGPWLVASAGVRILHAGVGEVWLVSGPLAASHVVHFYRTVKQRLPGVAEMLNLHRIQAMVLESFEDGRRLAEGLGFEREGLMRCHTPDGENVILYGRLF